MAAPGGIRTSTVLALCSTVVLLLGALVGCQTHPVEESPVIDRPGRVSFESLGWTEDALLTSDSQTAKVRFRLPDDAVQAEPLWYGVRLAYEWTVNPGVAASAGQGGDYSKLIGEWNGYGFYQLKLKPLADLDGGYKWSMVDMVNGSSHGYETSPTFTAASTNFAMYKAVTPGWNEVSIYPFLFDASNKDVRIIVKKESEIVATSWGPPSFEGNAGAELKDGAIHLWFSGENQGWGAPGLEVQATVFREDGSIHPHSWDLGPLQPLGSVGFQQTIPNKHESPVLSVFMELDWGSGRQPFLAWPKEPEPPWYTRAVFRSAIGAMIALVVVWVGGPMLFRAVREARRART